MGNSSTSLAGLGCCMGGWAGRWQSGEGKGGRSRWFSRLHVSRTHRCRLRHVCSANEPVGMERSPLNCPKLLFQRRHAGAATHPNKALLRVCSLPLVMEVRISADSSSRGPPRPLSQMEDGGGPKARPPLPGPLAVRTKGPQHPRLAVLKVRGLGQRPP